jgi:hypothetical protein
MIRSSVAVVFSLLLTTSARADPPPESCSPNNAMVLSLGGVARAEELETRVAARHCKHSPNAALALGIGGTVAATALLTGAVLDSSHQTSPIIGLGELVIGGGLGLVGLVVLPGLGHAYGEHRWSATGALALRLVGAVAVFGGFLGLDGDGNTRTGIAAGVLAAGGAVILSGAIWDIATTRSAARRYNAEHAPQLAITPTAIRTASHATAPGLAVTARF